jgi:hypothetical protein
MEETVEPVEEVLPDSPALMVVEVRPVVVAVVVQPQMGQPQMAVTVAVFTRPGRCRPGHQEGRHPARTARRVLLTSASACFSTAPLPPSGSAPLALVGRVASPLVATAATAAMAATTAPGAVVVVRQRTDRHLARAAMVLPALLL